MSILRKIILLLGAIMIFSIAATFAIAGRFVLVAHEDISIDNYPMPDPSRPPPNGKVEKGARVPVVSCDDLKSYSAIHVLLENGQQGYVINGRFVLEKLSLWSSSEAPISYSCPPALH